MLKRIGACALVVSLATMAAPALADEGGGFANEDGASSSGPSGPGTGVSGGVESGELRVRVEVSGSTGEGESYAATRSVGVAPMCWYERGWSGRE